jgi:hypothetical protein
MSRLYSAMKGWTSDLEVGSSRPSSHIKFIEMDQVGMYDKDVYKVMLLFIFVNLHYFCYLFSVYTRTYSIFSFFRFKICFTFLSINFVAIRLGR